MPDNIEIMDNAHDWENAMFLYEAAMRNIETKINILNTEFKHIYGYNPIEHIKTRIKKPESITKKMAKNGIEINLKNMVKHIHDVAGIRIICSFTGDIYKISRMIMQQSDISILQVKDYIAQPKPNGYTSLHIIISVPIYMASGIVETKVEVQIRTIAMDFWASLEHKIHYKFDGKAPKNIVKDLKECADIVAKLDERMFNLNKMVQSENEKHTINFSGFKSFSNEER